MFHENTAGIPGISRGSYNFHTQKKDIIFIAVHPYIYCDYSCIQFHSSRFQYRNIAGPGLDVVSRKIFFKGSLLA